MKPGTLILAGGIVLLAAAGLYFFVFKPRALAGESSFGGPPIIPDGEAYTASLPAGPSVEALAKDAEVRAKIQASRDTFHVGLWNRNKN